MDAQAVIDALDKALAAGDLAGARAVLNDLKRGGGTAAVQLAAEVLHELRQPLLGVKAYAQLLREEPGAAAIAGQMLSQVDRMEQIISDFIRLSTDKAAPQTRLDLALPAREAKRLFLLSTDATRLQLEVEAAPGVEVQGSGRLLEQLVLNLLNNARDAMNGRGRVKLVVTTEGARPALYVADWGPGIPPELREKVFEPYVTTKGRGSGLGLAVCRRIAAEHGAQLGLAPPDVLTDSPPPATVFRVLFPQVGATAAAKPARQRILIVDDEAVIRSVLAELLGREFEVVAAETAEEGIAQLSRSRFDLVVTDKNLPGKSGLEVAREARRLDPESRVVVMTGYPSLVTAQEALELGVVDYLLKPFDDIREVRATLRAALSVAAPSPHPSATRRVDVFEDNPDSADQLAEALAMLGLEPRVMATPSPPADPAPAAVVVSWDFAPAHGPKAVELAKANARGAPFVVMAGNLSMDCTLESLRGGAAACLPKLVLDVRALARELARALKLPPP